MRRGVPRTSETRRRLVQRLQKVTASDQEQRGYEDEAEAHECQGLLRIFPPHSQEHSGRDTGQDCPEVHHLPTAAIAPHHDESDGQETSQNRPDADKPPSVFSRGRAGATTRRRGRGRVWRRSPSPENHEDRRTNQHYQEKQERENPRGLAKPYAGRNKRSWDVGWMDERKPSSIFRPADDDDSP